MFPVQIHSNTLKKDFSLVYPDQFKKQMRIFNFPDFSSKFLFYTWSSAPVAKSSSSAAIAYVMFTGKDYFIDSE